MSFEGDNSREPHLGGSENPRVNVLECARHTAWHFLHDSESRAVGIKNYLVDSYAAAGFDPDNWGAWLDALEEAFHASVSQVMEHVDSVADFEFEARGLYGQVDQKLAVFAIDLHQQAHELGLYARGELFDIDLTAQGVQKFFGPQTWAYFDQILEQRGNKSITSVWCIAKTAVLGERCLVFANSEPTEENEQSFTVVSLDILQKADPDFLYEKVFEIHEAYLLWQWSNEVLGNLGLHSKPVDHLMHPRVKETLHELVAQPDPLLWQKEIVSIQNYLLRMKQFGGPYEERVTEFIYLLGGQCSLEET